MWWIDLAACVNKDPEIFFEFLNYERAKRICNTCPVKAECLREGLKQDLKFSRGGLHGVWGGLTPNERELIHKRGKIAA